MHRWEPPLTEMLAAAAVAAAGGSDSAAARCLGAAESAVYGKAYAERLEQKGIHTRTHLIWTSAIVSSNKEIEGSEAHHWCSSIKVAPLQSLRHILSQH